MANKDVVVVVVVVNLYPHLTKRQNNTKIILTNPQLDLCHKTLEDKTSKCRAEFLRVFLLLHTAACESCWSSSQR